MLGFSTAAWKLAPRDKFIGWTPQLREKNLPLVVDNPRFLILPWIEIPNLGSHILAIVRRRLPEDWAERYNTTPVLIETFVETPRYTAPCTGHRAGSMSEPPKGAGATTATGSTTSRKKMSGSGPFDGIGNAHSTAKISLPSEYACSAPSNGRHSPRPDGTFTFRKGIPILILFLIPFVIDSQREFPMSKAYSADLRQRIVDAIDGGGFAAPGGEAIWRQRQFGDPLRSALAGDGQRSGGCDGRTQGLEA